MRRIYFFMLLNTLFIPITAASTAQLFFKQLESLKFENWPNLVSTNMMTQQLLYIKFIIQLTFITNGINLMDIPHRFLYWYKKRTHESNQEKTVYKELILDEYQYNLGYNQSYCLVIFINCLLFSCIVPIIPFFACLYFYIKYQTDKYNLVFTYFKKYESGG